MGLISIFLEKKEKLKDIGKRLKEVAKLNR